MRNLKNRQVWFFVTCIILTIPFGLASASESTLDENLKCLKMAYPDYIQSVNSQYITWVDGTQMPLYDNKRHKTTQEKLDSPSLADQLDQGSYVIDDTANYKKYIMQSDVGRVRYEPFFKKMYGQSAASVQSKLTTFYWMPKIFGKKFRCQVTTVNSINQKLTKISEELEALVLKHPEFRKYLDNPGGFFNWRVIAGTNRHSPHSFGMTIDINAKYSNYWQWDLAKLGLPVKENTPLEYRNNIPLEIVAIFEKYGFIWGGKWYHYDTMHFEYRPELFCRNKSYPK